jgi:hypothetical protein
MFFTGIVFRTTFFFHHLNVTVCFIFCFSEEMREQIGNTYWLQMLCILGPVLHVRNLKVALTGHHKDNHTYTLITACGV